MTPEQRCETCVFWDRPDPERADQRPPHLGWGQCDWITDFDYPGAAGRDAQLGAVLYYEPRDLTLPAPAEIGELTLMLDLYTAPSFGCVHWRLR